MIISHSTLPKDLGGMIWNANSDCLYVSIGETSSPSSTKKNVISDIARILTYVLVLVIAPTIITMTCLFSAALVAQAQLGRGDDSH